jgi:hypothetical protein
MSFHLEEAEHSACASKAGHYCTAGGALGSNLFTFENKIFMLPESN